MSEKYFDALEKKIDEVKDLIPECSCVVFLDGVTNQVTRAANEFVIKQFERHGYSEKEVMDLAVAGKIKTVEDRAITTYFVNDLALFSIMRMEYTLADRDENYYNFTAKLVCEDLIPAVRGDGD